LKRPSAESANAREKGGATVWEETSISKTKRGAKRKELSQKKKRKGRKKKAGKGENKRQGGEKAARKKIEEVTTGGKRDCSPCAKKGREV